MAKKLAKGLRRSTKPVVLDSVSKFIAEMDDTLRIGVELRPTIWFRGHAVASWQLKPGILRDEFVERARQFTVNPNGEANLYEFGLETQEKTVNEEFRRMGVSLLPPTAVDPARWTVCG